MNRFFTVENPEPQPDLECLVGVHSAAASEMYRVKCTEAWNISVKYDRKKANSLAADKHISEHDRRLRTIRLWTTPQTDFENVFPGLESKAVESSTMLMHIGITGLHQ